MNAKLYLASLDKEKTNMFTLQLANMKRVKKNKAVYIFDEVGAGKTISSGFSIIQLLFQEIKQEIKHVLIVTAPSVVEEFKYKLENVLNLKVGEEGTFNKQKYKIDIINYDYRNIEKKIFKKEEENKYDFIVVDEAHEFLNEDTQRYKELIQLKAEKILFMTATPIKNNEKDINRYPEIAQKILLEEKPENKLEDKLKEAYKTFNPEAEVSRYFKETVINIEKVEGNNENDFADRKSSRLWPEIWEYENDAKGFIADKIIKTMEGDENNNSRFIIFVRYIKDAYEIGEKLEEKKFNKFELDKKNANNTYCIVTGKTADRKKLLNKFSSTKGKDIPQVLILTYQIGEQGIDFPSYNYVINYHIPATPSRLEQRFGRIDRLNSIHKELKICYVIKKKGFDLNTLNFYIAMGIYIKRFLPLLPSKNCLIGLDVLMILKNPKGIDDLKNVLKKLEDDKVKEKIHDREKKKVSTDDKEHNSYIDERNIEIDENREEDEDKDLMSLVDERDIEFDEDYKKFAEKIIDKIKEEINIIESLGKDIEKCGIISTKGNANEVIAGHIFSRTAEGNGKIETIAIDEIAIDIADGEEYKEFSKEHDETMELMRNWNDKKAKIEIDIEGFFLVNKFEYIFPKDNDFIWVKDKYFKGIEEVDQNTINALMSTLPFYDKFCFEYKKIIHSYAYTKTNSRWCNSLKKYQYDPMEKSIREIYGKRKELSLNLENVIFERYEMLDRSDYSGTDYEKWIQKKLGEWFYIKKEDDIIVSSNWIKLFYKYSSKEEFPEDIGLFPKNRSLFKHILYDNGGKKRKHTWNIFNVKDVEKSGINNTKIDHEITKKIIEDM